MTVHTDRIVLVFPIAEIGRAAAASLQTLEIVNGRQFENLVPLDPALVSDYSDQFSLPLITQVESLTAERDQLKTDKQSLTDQLAAANATVAERDATIATLQSRIAELENPSEPQVAQCTPRQGKLALLQSGLYETATMLIESAGVEAKIYWESATVWYRNEPLLVGMAQQMGLTDEQLDQMFALAGTL